MTDKISLLNVTPPIDVAFCESIYDNMNRIHITQFRDIIMKEFNETWLEKLREETIVETDEQWYCQMIYNGLVTKDGEIKSLYLNWLYFIGEKYVMVIFGEFFPTDQISDDILDAINEFRSKHSNNIFVSKTQLTLPST